MDKFYTIERNAQIVISLMKAHGIKRVVSSPGTTNVCFLSSIRHDPYFEIYSAADERSAAYIACGMAAETGEPVALNCTGATSSRNYMPALTEAYYSQLPVLAITSSLNNNFIGQNVEQVTNRTAPPPDVAKISVQLPFVNCSNDEWGCIVRANQAMLELCRDGGGPAHINLETHFSEDYSVKELPPVRVIKRITDYSEAPKITDKRVAIMVGPRIAWSPALAAAADEFCEKYNAIVLCDATSNYKGKYRILAGLATRQDEYVSVVRELDLMIHIGQVSSAKFKLQPKKVWRVNQDGELRDTFKKLTYIFQSTELAFFQYYNSQVKTAGKMSFYKEAIEEQRLVFSSVPELPFSNFWIAKESAAALPQNSKLHLAIRNSLRAWSFFDVPDTVNCYSNTGGFGIDGCTSATIGASLANLNTTVFLVTGDLAFFYDLNSLGNRHINNNLRILLVNNGMGVEFKFLKSPCSCFGEETNEYLAAGGHYGNQSPDLVRHYAQDLGFEYMTASDKESYKDAAKNFFSVQPNDKPIIFEVFTKQEDEVKALEMLENLLQDKKIAIKNKIKDAIGESGVKMIHKILK